MSEQTSAVGHRVDHNGKPTVEIDDRALGIVLAGVGETEIDRLAPSVRSPTGRELALNRQGVPMEQASRSEVVQMLKQVPLFTGLTKRQMTAVAKVVDLESFEPGKVLVKELDVVQRLLVIREGTAAVTRRGIVRSEDGTGIEQGASRRLATLGPGDVVGELSLIDGNRASATVTTETRLEAFALYRTRFNKLLSSTPEMYKCLLLGMVGRVRSIDQRGDVTG